MRNGNRLSAVLGAVFAFGWLGCGDLYCGGQACGWADDQDPDGKEGAIYVGTPPDIVDKMLEMAQLQKSDVVVDLGCGDGRIVVAAAARYGCRAIGYELNTRRVQQARDNARKQHVEKLVTIEQRDIFTVDLRGASVVTLFLLPEMNIKLLPQLHKLKAGSRIVAHEFGIEGVPYDRRITVKSRADGVPRDVFLYVVPLKKSPLSEIVPSDR